MRYLLVFLFFIGLTGCKSSQWSKSVKFASNPVVAHRGAWKTQNLPQNSIASLKRAIELGCAGSEFDVRMTKDSVLIINHDPHYNDLVIAESNYAELAQKKFPNGETLPTLKAYLLAGMENNKTTGLVCEIKPTKSANGDKVLAEKVVALVNELHAENYVSYYISFSSDILKRILELDPKAKTQYLNGTMTPEEIEENGMSGLDYAMPVFKKNTKWIAQAKARKLILNAWTVNKSEDMDWFLGYRFDYITTNEPELLFERYNR